MDEKDNVQIIDVKASAGSGVTMSALDLRTKDAKQIIVELDMAQSVYVVKKIKEILKYKIEHL